MKKTARPIDTLARDDARSLDEAERRYGRVVAREPKNGDAWHLLGRVALQKGELPEAAARVLQAIRQRPEVPAFHVSLGEILAAQQRDREAMLCYQEALRLEPGFVPALVNLGNALQNQKRYREACIWYWQAIRKRPDCPEAFNNLGNALRWQGEFEGALACYREAHTLQPGNPVHAVNVSAGLIHLGRHPEAEEWARRALLLQPRLAGALSNLSIALTGQQRYAEAEPFCRRALEEAPGAAHLHLNLGCLLLHRDRPAEAEKALRQALALQPDYPQAMNNLAVALHQQEREEEAAEWCERLLLIQPGYGEAWSNLGTVRQAQRRHCEAIACFDEALNRKPDHAKSHVCRAVSLLSEGRYREGFEEFEWRWKLLGGVPRPWRHPAWDGSPLEGKTILLWAEQGLGDTVQFVRYAAKVRELGGRVVVKCPECLVPMLRGVRGVDEVVAQSGELPRFDVQAPLVSLPRLLRTSVDRIPAAVPYMYADPERVTRCRATLGPARGLRVGVVWSGNPLQASDRERSIPLALLSPWREIPGVEWHSLQLGQRGWLRAILEDAGDVGDLAAWMSCLDLVVSVDTMPAHLAGALGLPVWTMLAWNPDWRWRAGQDTSPWYPGMRLFRQERRGQWEAVVARVGEAIGALVQAFPDATDKDQ